MIRARFKANADDPRPIFWPINHPYWITGYGVNLVGDATYATVVAYAEDEAEIMKLWPDATDIEYETESAYVFTDRFQCPNWFKGQA